MRLMVRRDLTLHSLNHPAVGTLVLNTGIKGDPVVAGSRRIAGVRFQYLLDADNLISPRAQLGSPGNGIARLQGMQVAEVIPDTSVVSRNAAVPVPKTGVREMASTFCKGAAISSLVDLDGQANSRDLQRTQMTAGIIEVVRNLRVARRNATPDAGTAGIGNEIRRHDGYAAASHRPGRAVLIDQIGRQQFPGVQCV